MFESVIKKYYRHKKAAKEAQKQLKLEKQQQVKDNSPLDIVTSESPPDEADEPTFLEQTEIVSFTDIKQQYDWYVSNFIDKKQDKKETTIDYNRLSLKEALSRMKEEVMEGSDDDDEVILHPSTLLETFDN